MAIKISKQDALLILDILGSVTEKLEPLFDKMQSSEGSEPGKSLDEILENPVGYSIWRIGDVFEILTKAEVIPE